MTSHGKKKPRISLRTLARIAGVSVSTASRALHNHPVISAAVRKKIKDLARRRGYAINPLVAQVYAEARAGRGFQHLGTLAYITAYDTPDWWKAHPTLRGFHDGVVDRAKQTGLGVNEFWAHEPGLMGRRLTQILRARGIGGVVLAPVPGRNAEGMIDFKYFSGALVGESVRTPRLNRAVPNQRHAAQLAIRELTRLGYRRIGLVLRRRYHAMTDFNMLSTFLLLQHGLARAGVQCPRDVGLVLLDWDEETKEEFAAVDQNATAVGAAAVDIVLGQMRQNERGLPSIPQTVLVDSLWRPGASVRRVGAEWSPTFLQEAPEMVAPKA